MGYIAHDAVIAIVEDAATVQKIAEFRAAMADEDAKYLVGPVIGINYQSMYCFLPDGSKEGWEPSDRIEKLRYEFAKIAQGVDYGDSFANDVIQVRFGGDFGSDIGHAVLSTTDHRWVSRDPINHFDEGENQRWNVDKQEWEYDPLNNAMKATG